MIRGTTPTNTFTLPFEPPIGTKFRIVYAQDEKNKEVILFERTTGTCTVEGCKLSVRLTAEETLMFDCTPHWVDGRFQPLPVWIQIGYETPGGDINWSKPIETTVERCLRKDGVVNG